MSKKVSMSDRQKKLAEDSRARQTKKIFQQCLDTDKGMGKKAADDLRETIKKFPPVRKKPNLLYDGGKKSTFFRRKNNN